VRLDTSDQSGWPPVSGGAPNNIPAAFGPPAEAEHLGARRITESFEMLRVRSFEMAGTSSPSIQAAIRIASPRHALARIAASAMSVTVGVTGAAFDRGCVRVRITNFEVLVDPHPGSSGGPHSVFVGKARYPGDVGARTIGT